MTRLRVHLCYRATPMFFLPFVNASYMQPELSLSIVCDLMICFGCSFALGSSSDSSNFPLLCRLANDLTEPLRSSVHGALANGWFVYKGNDKSSLFKCQLYNVYSQTIKRNLCGNKCFDVFTNYLKKYICTYCWSKKRNFYSWVWSKQCKLYIQFKFCSVIIIQGCSPPIKLHCCFLLCLFTKLFQ